jgi:hypothetical protein
MRHKLCKEVRRKVARIPRFRSSRQALCCCKMRTHCHLAELYGRNRVQQGGLSDLDICSKMLTVRSRIEGSHLKRFLHRIGLCCQHHRLHMISTP